MEAEHVMKQRKLSFSSRMACLEMEIMLKMIMQVLLLILLIR